MTSSMTAEEENRIRRLRDLVYGVPTTFLNWENCKENWFKPDQTAWLLEQAEKVKQHAS